MSIHPLLQDSLSQVFLIHCTITSHELEAALLVVDGFIADDWVTVSKPSGEGPQYRVQLPAEVISQPERYKGYACTLPLQRIA